MRYIWISEFEWNTIFYDNKQLSTNFIIRPKRASDPSGNLPIYRHVPRVRLNTQTENAPPARSLRPTKTTVVDRRSLQVRT